MAKLLSEDDILDLKVKKFLDLKKNKMNMIKFDEPSDLKVSVMVAVCEVNIQFHLKNISQNLYNDVYRNIIDKENVDFNILGVICNDVYIKTSLNQKEKKRKKINESEFLNPKKKKKTFDNQVTVIVKSPKSGKIVNIKLFSNSKLQITGLQREQDGIDSIEYLLDYLKKYDNALIGDIQNLEISNYKIVNINNSFNLFFKIDRKKLYNILIQNTNLYISHERQRSAGILIYYKYNCNNKCKDGLCHCVSDLKCKGKGDNGTCKNVTIMIYESGKGNIMGVNSMIQAIEAYEFIKNIICNNQRELIKLCVEDIEITKEDIQKEQTKTITKVKSKSKVKPKKKKTLVEEEIES